ncbi:MAG: sugar ABC transporter substrate-binding protein [Clostridiales Family XIII bacterium]|jgi:ribose transport system substrate-binding protein|nr:sugar ABC transporter substrate-binding protein [Clostridiales Family XIII bacterium]
MKRKTLALLLCVCVALMFTLGACGGGGSSAGGSSAPAEEPVAEEPDVEADVTAADGQGVPSQPPSGDTSAVEGTTVGVIPITLSNGFHQAEKIWREKYAEEYGITLKYLDGEFDQQTIVNNLDQLIAEGVDAIILHSYEVDSVVPGIDEARAQGIPIIEYYLETPNEIPFVAINEATAALKMGEAAATAWIEAHPDEPIVYSVVDYIDSPVVQTMRTQPFIQGIKNVAPDAKEGAIVDGGGTRDTGYKVAQDIIQSHPETNIFYGASSDYSLAIYPALQEAGRGKATDGVPETEIVVGTDATGEEMKLVYDPSSSFKVTMGLTPKDNGKAIMDTMVRVMIGELDADTKIQIDTFDQEFDYWSTTVEDARTWYTDQYGMEPEF